MASEKQGKTEKPTGKKLADAKKKGDVPRSQELTNAMLLFIALMFFSLFFPYLGRNISGAMRKYFGIAAEMEISIPVVHNIFKDSFWLYIRSLIPLFIVLMSVIILISILQAGGFMIIGENLRIKFDKFNVIKGLKKLIFSINALFELMKSIVKVIIIGAIAYFTIKGEMNGIINLPSSQLTDIVSFMGSVFFRLAFNIIIFLMILSVLDYLWQRYQYMKKLKMSKDDIKDEYKQMEGDPKIKGKRKQKQFEMAMSRMMSDVPKADVIITNPTHYAVALEYKYKKMVSPKLIAKGKDLIAEKIKKIAKEHNIPIIENPPVARGIYAVVEINESIPSDLFKPVAEILAYIYKLKGRKVG